MERIVFRPILLCWLRPVGAKFPQLPQLLPRPPHERKVAGSNPPARRGFRPVPWVVHFLRAVIHRFLCLYPPAMLPCRMGNPFGSGVPFLATVLYCLFFSVYIRLGADSCGSTLLQLSISGCCCFELILEWSFWTCLELVVVLV